MTTVKKIILFLFGIVLIVFGNKAAIDTIFRNRVAIKKSDSDKEKRKERIPLFIEKTGIKEVGVFSDLIPEKTSELKTESIVKQEEKKTSTTKSPEKNIQNQSVTISEKKEEVQVEQATQTKIEPVQEESATATQ